MELKILLNSFSVGNVVEKSIFFFELGDCLTEFKFEAIK